MAHCLGFAFTAAWLLVERKLNTPKDKYILNLLEEGIIPLLETWWNISQDFVPQWLTDQVFVDRTVNCSHLADSLALAFLVPSDDYWPMNGM